MTENFQEMEVGGEDDIRKNTGITLNMNPSSKKQNLLGNIKGLMKSRIKVEMPQKEFIKQFKWVLIYIAVISILIIIFMTYHTFFGFINLSLAVLGSVFLCHGIWKKMMGTFRMGTAFWILELVLIAIEAVYYIFKYFGQIFTGDSNFFVGLIKFVFVAILLLAFLLVCGFFTYHMINKKNLFTNTYTDNQKNTLSNQAKGGITFSAPIQTPGTVAKENK